MGCVAEAFIPRLRNCQRGHYQLNWMLDCFRTPGGRYSLNRSPILSDILFVQGLPVCVALSLTIVAKRMAKHHVLVKNLATVETLGCISVLCTDKTGTLTLGQMVRLE